MEKTNWPTVTIIIITYNSERTIRKVLDSIHIQDYPQEKLDILVVDGNSTDKTLSILKMDKMKIKIVQSPYPRDPEACRGVGLLHAKGEIISFIDSDNFMPHKLWLKNMMIPFVNHPEIVGSATLRFAYIKTHNLLNRYFALLGSADPVGLYLGKADKLSYVSNKWVLYGKKIFQAPNYFLVEYDYNHFPTLGSNGFCARKKYLKMAKSDPEHYFHIDVPYDLSLLGYNKYAIVKDTIIHDTATNPSIISYVLKRANYMKLHYQKRAQDRRYKVFDPQKSNDIIKIILFVFYAITLVQPLLVAINGYRKKRDLAWFVHPFFCFCIVIAYAFAIFPKIVKG